MFSRKTKIVCSLGPASESDEIIEKIILAGMNVARFNFSHGSHDEHRRRMESVRRCAKKLGRPVALLLDTKGPEIRTGVVACDGKISIKKGDTVELTVDGSPATPAEAGKNAHISITWKDLPERAAKGIRILIADGLLELSVERSENGTVYCTAQNTATIGSRKNVNIIGLHAGLPIMTETDRADIAFGVSMGVDFIAASFVSFATEIIEIREYLTTLNSHAHIIAKIENEEGLDNIREIVAVADGVMVARGDMGVQLPVERIPLAQKHIIAVCRAAGKPVITATQMLDSMITNPRPTRAELTDVANAIFDGTDAVMLSGETTVGAYPVEAVETMARIAVTVEDSADYCERMRETQAEEAKTENMGQIMAHMAYLTAAEIRAIVIITPTMSGNTARMISMFRPEQSILAVTPDEGVQHRLLLNWGVVPFMTKVAADSEEMVQNAIKIALDNGAVHISDRAVICAGIPLVSPIMVNTVRVVFVGNVLASSVKGGHSTETKTRTSGRIMHTHSAEDSIPFLRSKKGEILVCSTLDESYIPILRLVDGVICEGESSIPPDLMQYINPNLVWITCVSGAFKILENGLTVTVDGKERLVYEGIV